MADSEDRQWHLDRKVPIGIIGAILLQTLVLGAYIGKLDTRVEHLEQAQSMRNDERDRLVILETQMKAIHNTLVRIENRLRKRDDRKDWLRRRDDHND